MAEIHSLEQQAPAAQAGPEAGRPGEPPPPGQQAQQAGQRDAPATKRARRGVQMEEEDHLTDFLEVSNATKHGCC